MDIDLPQMVNVSSSVLARPSDRYPRHQESDESSPGQRNIDKAGARHLRIDNGHTNIWTQIQMTDTAIYSNEERMQIGHSQMEMI